MGSIALIGATGRAGSQLLEEALRRGHRVTALARQASAKLTPDRPGLAVRDVDAADATALGEAVRGHDAVFSSARFTAYPAQHLIDVVQQAGVARLQVVGGAGSLLLPSGQRVIDDPAFPPAWKPGSQAGIEYLDVLRGERALDWTYLSPSMEFVVGERTGQFRLGRDEALFDAAGRSWISFADYAIAFLDEFEQPAHSRQRFTVGY